MEKKWEKGEEGRGRKGRRKKGEKWEGEGRRRREGR